jgi:hypothetical protein
MADQPNKPGSLRTLVRNLTKLSNLKPGERCLYCGSVGVEKPKQEAVTCDICGKDFSREHGAKRLIRGRWRHRACVLNQAQVARHPEAPVEKPIAVALVEAVLKVAAEKKGKRRMKRRAK